MHMPDRCGAFFHDVSAAKGLISKGHSVSFVYTERSTGVPVNGTYRGIGFKHYSVAESELSAADVWTTPHYPIAVKVRKLNERFQKPLIITAHFGEELSIFERPGPTAEAALYVSKFMKNYADANLHNASSIKQSAVIYPIILKNDVTLPEDREPGTYVTLVNGNMLKGVDIFLRIADRMKDTKFLGIRPYYRHVNVHDTDNVTWESYTDDVRTVLAKTRVLIVASYTESWSRIAFEAMYNGIPVVYSRPYEASTLPGGTTHAMKEWIEDGAIDVNRSSIDEWVAAIELLKDPDTYAEWSKKASEQSRKINVFSMVDAYENFLRDFSTKYKSGVTVSARAPQKSSGAPPAEPPRLPTMGVIPRMSFSGGRFGRKK